MWVYRGFVCQTSSWVRQVARQPAETTGSCWYQILIWLSEGKKKRKGHMSPYCSFKNDCRSGSGMRPNVKYTDVCILMCMQCTFGMWMVWMCRQWRQKTLSTAPTVAPVCKTAFYVMLLLWKRPNQQTFSYQYGRNSAWLHMLRVQISLTRNAGCSSFYACMSATGFRKNVQ